MEKSQRDKKIKMLGSFAMIAINIIETVTMLCIVFFGFPSDALLRVCLILLLVVFSNVESSIIGYRIGTRNATQE